MADIFDEVSEDLRAERAKRIAARLAIPGAILLLLVVGGAAGWQVWRAREAQRSAEVAGTFLAAARDAGDPVAVGPATSAQTAALQAFQQLAADAPAGYRTLARLRAAALLASTGQLPAALEAWDALAQDGGADPLLRDLAALLWAQHGIDGGDPAAVEARLNGLTAPDNPWRPLAQESRALLALRTGRTDEARTLLRALLTDSTAPDGVRARANGLLTGLGDVPGQAPGAGG